MGKTALIIIDMQNDFCLPGAPFEVESGMSIIPALKKVLAGYRKYKLPVFHVIRHYRADGSDCEITRFSAFKNAGGALICGTKGAEIVKELEPVSGEYVIVKKRWSALFQTELDSLLRRLDVDQIVITGVQTPNCIRATAWDANSLDYEVIVLTDATGANTSEIHQANLQDMKNIGIKLMTADEFVRFLPRIPKENIKKRILAEL